MFKLLEHLHLFTLFLESKNTHCTLLTTHNHEFSIRRNAHTSAFRTIIEIVCFIIFGRLNPTRLTFWIFNQIQRSDRLECSILNAPASYRGIIWASKSKIAIDMQSPHLICPTIVGTIVSFHMTNSSYNFRLLWIDFVNLYFKYLRTESTNKHFIAQKIQWSDCGMLTFQSFALQNLLKIKTVKSFVFFR